MVPLAPHCLPGLFKAVLTWNDITRQKGGQLGPLVGWACVSCGLGPETVAALQDLVRSIVKAPGCYPESREPLPTVLTRAMELLGCVRAQVAASCGEGAAAQLCVSLWTAVANEVLRWKDEDAHAAAHAKATKDLDFMERPERIFYMLPYSAAQHVIDNEGKMRRVPAAMGKAAAEALVQLFTVLPSLGPEGAAQLERMVDFICSSMPKSFEALHALGPAALQLAGELGAEAKGKAFATLVDASMQARELGQGPDFMHVAGHTSVSVSMSDHWSSIMCMLLRPYASSAFCGA